MPRAVPTMWWQQWRVAIAAGVGAVVLFKAITEVVALNTATPGHPGTALLRPWNVWDTGWWTTIADRGYAGASTPDADATAFAPAYPILIRVAMVVAQIDSLTAAMLVSTLALLVAAVVLFRVVETAYGRGAAVATLLVLLTFPAAFFLAAPYSEALSLAAIAVAMYGMQEQRWWIAGTAAAVATLSKYPLIIVPIAVLIEYVVREHPPRPRQLLAVLAPTGVALGGFMAFMQINYRSPLHFLSAEKTAWLHSFTTPDHVLRRIVDTFVHPETRPAWATTNLIDDAIVIAVVALAVWMLASHHRRDHPGWTALIALTAAEFLCMGVPDSAARYLLPIAPVFVVLGVAAARRPKPAALLIAGSTALMLLQLSRFTEKLWTG